MLLFQTTSSNCHRMLPRMTPLLRSLIWITLGLTSTACVSQQKQEASPLKPIPLVIFAGQSNMQGYKGNAAAYPADPQQLDSGIPFYWAIPKSGRLAQMFPRIEVRSQGWVNLGPQAGLFPAGHFGPEIQFARQLTQTTARPIAIFKFALGGTGLATVWKRPGDGGLYDKFTQEYQRATNLLRKRGQEPDPQALIWIQGEEDAKTPELAAQYQERLQLLVQDFRENQLDRPQLPVILGLDEQHYFVVDNPQVITAQEAIAAADPHIIRTSMVGLEKADYSHLTPAGLVEHGDRLAAAWLELHKVKDGKPHKAQ